MRKASAVEKEPQSAQNMPPERRVEQMFAALKKYRPAFILAVLPTDGSNSALYGLNISSLSLPLSLYCFFNGFVVLKSCDI